MIKVEDLRIGNYVNFMIDRSTWMIGKVKAINPNKATVDSYNIKYCNLSPIELTEELLLKCGFIENENYEFPSFDECVHKDNKWFGIGEFNGKYYIVDFMDQLGCEYKLQYLHQLQNIFYALTQKELEIKL